MLPSAFAKALEQKVFTNGESDLKLVANIYLETFNEAIGCAKTLWFVSLQWGDAEAEQIAALLPFCSLLEHLALRDNCISSEGAAIVVQAACACATLQGLDLKENLIEAASHGDMIEQWKEAGKKE